MRFPVRQRPLLSACSALTLALMLVPVSAQQAPEKVDYDAIYRIKQEGFQNSKVMEIMSWLTDVYGPRLTNSPGFRKAGEWAVKEMTGWGLTNVKLEPFGPFGRGWANEKFSMMATTPGGSFPVIGYPQAWTAGTNGVLSGDAALAVIETPEDIAAQKGKLKGKIVLTQAMREVAALWTPPAQRYTAEQLLAMEAETDQAGRGGRGGRAGGPGGGRGAAQQFARTRMQFFAREGVLATLEPGTGRSDHGAYPVQGSNANRDAKEPPVPTQITVATEHYNRLARLVRRGIPVRVELDARSRFIDETDASNIIAEIPGTDKADEVVMLGAHFDSWHAGTGATDNAAGSAAMMEAMRILKTTGVRLRRTVRLALWTGEEQGLLGSREYVKQHFGDRDTMVLTAQHAKLSAYFNMDNGSGAIRGVYLQGNEAVRPIFAAWMEPFRSIGMTTLSIRGTASTDHMSFDEVGLPGFQFIQDPLEYSTHSHHTNMDVYDRLQAEDLVKNATIIAAFVYEAANRDELLPRKALPRARNPRPTTTQ